MSKLPPDLSRSSPSTARPSGEKTSADLPKTSTVRGSDLLTVDVNDENGALNLLVAFLGLAQSRGCFAINESAKIFDCIKIFQRDLAETE